MGVIAPRQPFQNHRSWSDRTEFYTKCFMRALLHTEFTTLLDRADVSQAKFARLTGVTARQVNNWARGRAAVPRWAALMAVTLEELTPEALSVLLDEATFSWHEVLGIAPETDAAGIRTAMARLALLYHPDTGGQADQMVRITSAYEAVQQATSRVGFGTR